MILKVISVSDGEHIQFVCPVCDRKATIIQMGLCKLYRAAAKAELATKRSDDANSNYVECSASCGCSKNTENSTYTRRFQHG